MILTGDWAPATKPVSFALPPDALYLINLESPIVPQDAYPPAAKAGPHLATTVLPPAGLNAVFSLANNHMMDYGETGLTATRRRLDQAGFAYAGAGANLSAARRPLLVDDRGRQVGIISCCEPQFGAAQPHSSGVAVFGPWVYDAIRNLRAADAAVIVSIHAAVENSPWPYPHLQHLYRSYIDAGAAVVHGHHAHLPQGYEEYRGGLILYGMGNFAVDPDAWRRRPNSLWSLGAEIDLATSPLRWRPLSFEIRYEAGANIIRLEESTAEEHAAHATYLQQCNRPLADPQLLTALWHEVALRSYHQYGARYLGFAPAGRLAPLRRLLGALRRTLFNRATAAYPSAAQQQALLRYVMFACDSHRQIMITALGIESGEIADARTPESRQLVDELMPSTVGVLP